jgi:hypothetical protein
VFVGWAAALLLAPAANLAAEHSGGQIDPGLCLSIGVAALDGLLVGGLLARCALPSLRSLFRFKEPGRGSPGLMMLGLAGLSLALFWAAGIVYSVHVAWGRRPIRPVTILFAASLVVVVLSCLAAGDDGLWSFAFNGNLVLPAMLLGWWMNDSDGR